MHKNRRYAAVLAALTVECGLGLRALAERDSRLSLSAKNSSARGKRDVWAQMSGAEA